MKSIGRNWFAKFNFLGRNRYVKIKFLGRNRYVNIKFLGCNRYVKIKFQGRNRYVKSGRNLDAASLFFILIIVEVYNLILRLKTYNRISRLWIYLFMIEFSDLKKMIKFWSCLVFGKCKTKKFDTRPLLSLFFILIIVEVYNVILRLKTYNRISRLWTYLFMIEFSDLKKMIKFWNWKFVVLCLENVRLRNLILARYLQYVLMKNAFIGGNCKIKRNR